MQVCSVWCVCVCAELLQSHRSICDPMDYSSPGSYVRDFPGKKTGLGFHALLQGIFPTQGLNPVSLMSPALADGVFNSSAPYSVC